MKRRQFINLSSGAVASVLILPGFSVKTHNKDVYIENLIIGSGYGGAVTALRLTQAGKRCTIIEMGVNWNTTGEQYKPFSNMASPKENSTWLRKKTIAPMLNSATFPHQFTGLLDRVDYKDVKVYVGRGVGGDPW